MRVLLILWVIIGGAALAYAIHHRDGIVPDIFVAAATVSLIAGYFYGKHSIRKSQKRD